MKTKRFRIILAILLVAIVGGVGWLVLRPVEPVYGGKPLRVWIEVLDSVSPGINPPPVWDELGSDELAVLIKALEIRDNRIRMSYQRVHRVIWPKLPMSILRRLPRPLDTENVEINAILWLESRINDPRPAIPALIHVVKTDKSTVLKEMAAYELRRIGEGNKVVAAALCAALNDKDPHMHDNVAEALRRIDPEAAAKAGVQ